MWGHRHLLEVGWVAAIAECEAHSHDNDMPWEGRMKTHSP